MSDFLKSILSSMGRSLAMERPRKGHWTKIEPGARIGRDVVLGDWSIVGSGSRIGDGCVFGPWARVGRDAELGRGVSLGSHTVVQDGVRVPDGASFRDNDVVTPQGVVPDGAGGMVMGSGTRHAWVSGVFGTFVLPKEESRFARGESPFDREPLDWLSGMVQDWMFGRLKDFEDWRVESVPVNDAEADAMISAARQRRMRAKLRVIEGAAAESRPEDGLEP
jgi:hypothetical protein